MSHFTVLVVGANPEKQLQPFHEFECTGHSDEFVQDVDQTDEVQSQVDKEGLEEGLSYFGLEDRQVSSENEVDRDGQHKFGYAVVNDGKLVKAVRRTNPNSKWDWYELGGRWTGFFKLKSGAKGSTGRPGVFGNAAKGGWVDQALIRDIDFAGMRDSAGEEAGERYDLIASLYGGTIPQLNFLWRSLFDDNSPYKNLDIDAKRALYGEQHAMKEHARIRVENWENKNTKVREAAIWHEMEDYQCTRDEYVERARNRAIATFAVLKDGEWYEKGSMGWWGMVADEKDQNTWNDQFAALLTNLPEDTLVSVYDCHI